MNRSPSVPFSEDIVRRVCGEYLEMPGLRLKREQAQRLWGLDGATCTRLLEALVENGFLCRQGDGRYARSSDGALRTVPVKASLEFRSRRTAKGHVA
jgi:hypothetical protein